MARAQPRPWRRETLVRKPRWKPATLVVLLSTVLTLATLATTPVAADLDDDPETGPWAEDGSVFRDRVRLSADDPSADPVDWYRINLTAGPTTLDYLTISVNMTRNGGEQFFVWASLHDPDGALLTEVKATSFAVKSTATLCHRTGVYLVRVYTYSYFDCHYQLAFDITSRANVTDGDDTLGEATFLEPPADVTGHLHGILDPFDHYAVNLTRDATHYEFVQVRLALYGVPVGRTDLDLFLIVFDGQGVPREVSASTSNGSSEMAFFAATIENATVYIRAHAYGGNASYALNVTKVKVTDDGNNNIVRAVELDPGSSTEDGLNITDRLDYFKVNLTGGDILWAETETHDWDPVSRKPDLNIYMYDPTGLIINWSHSYDPFERASVTAPHGDPAAFYYVLVTFFDRNPSDGIDAWGDYTINITVDRAPRLIGDLPLVVEEDGSLEVLLDDLVDDEEDEELFVSVLPGDHVHATLAGDRITVVPMANFSGDADFTLQVADHLRLVELVVPVNVTPVPDAPGLVDPFSPITLDEDDQVTVDLNDIIVDGDGDPVQFAALWDENHTLGASTVAGSSLTIVPNADVFGNFTLPVDAWDDNGQRSTVLVPVQVLPVPDAPRVLIPEANVTIEEDQRGTTFDLTTVFSDPDELGLEYMVTEDTGSILFIVIGDDLLMDPAPDFHGQVTMTLEAMAGAQRVSSSLVVTVTSVVDPPLITDRDPDGDVTMSEMNARTFSITAEDPEGGTLAYEWYFDGVLLAGETLPRFELVTNHSSQGTHLVTVRVTNVGAMTEWNWSVQVDNVNRAPTLDLMRPRDGDTFEEGTNVVFEAEAEDPDGEALSVQWVEDGEVLGTGKAFATSGLKAGKHTITLRAVDPHGFATEANFTITIEEASGLPAVGAPVVLAALLLGCVMAAVWHRSRKD
ncbi:MAG: hypothetical protein JSW25_09990 [Thermoplasmata archaeon]|nr:MAG: hypothetical protein JSW25_09990 [Thermoplasmata archaeon]